MTTSRVIRGTRAKIFLYVCGVLIITGIIACYNNTLSQLDDVKKSNDVCHQQEENLSVQLQMISNYKQRLEKNLKTEKAQHEQTKTYLNTKLNEEKIKSEKSSSDAQIKLNSLQQHFNLLQTEYDDYKEECSKTQEEQQKEINDLQSKLKEVEEEVKKVQSSKESLKSQYLELQDEKERIQKQADETRVDKNDNESNINHMRKENDELKRELEQLKEKCSNQDTLQEPRLPSEVSSPKSFSKMSQASPDTYQINDSDIKSIDTNVLNAPPIVDKQEKMVLALPSSIDQKLPSSKSTTKSGLKPPSQAGFNVVKPIVGPTVTPETLVAFEASDKKKLPDGVVAIPAKKEDQNEQPEIINNRYQNVKNSANEEVVEKAPKEDLDKDNGAHEVFDAPVPQNHYDGLGFGDNDHVKNAEKQKFDKKHIDTLGNEEKRKNYDQEQADYKDLQNDVQLEENEEDDDIDGYDDHLARQKEPAVRN